MRRKSWSEVKGFLRGRISVASVFVLILFILSACGEDEKSGIVHIEPVELRSEEVPRQTEMPHSAGDSDGRDISMDSDLDSYVGEYRDYDLNVPSLEILKNEDGIFRIQIDVFRVTKLYDCVGYGAGNGIEFVSTEWDGAEEISGTITVEDEIATVAFTGWWFSFADTKEYKYHKTSDIPNMATSGSKVDVSTFVGEYNDYDTNEPNLEIQQNEDGTYMIQIGIFRVTQLEHCIGHDTETGIEFMTAERGDEEITGTITLEGNVAAVTFTGWWFPGETNVYRYRKTSNVPSWQ